MLKAVNKHVKDKMKAAGLPAAFILQLPDGQSSLYLCIVYTPVARRLRGIVLLPSCFFMRFFCPCFMSACFSR